MKLNSFIIFFLNLQHILSFSMNRRNLLEGLVAMNVLNNDDTIDYKYDVYKKNMNEEQPGELGIIQDLNNKIYFYGPVSQRSCFELKNKLEEVDVKCQLYHLQYNVNPPPIRLHIQSQGGSLYHTLYMVDLIQSLKTPVYTYVDGFAASAATLISVAGKKRFMTKNSLMLVHQLSGSDSGKYNELQDQMTNMNILMKIIKDIYLNNTKLNPEILNTLLQKDLWLDSEICLQYGLVDEIL